MPKSRRTWQTYLDDTLMTHAKLAAHALEYIDAHYTESTLEVRDIADVLHVSRYYLSHVFHETTGNSLRKHIGEVRMGHAAALFAVSDLQVKDVCRRVGYLSVGPFSTTFHNRFGLSPTAYRERYGIARKVHL